MINKEMSNLLEKYSMLIRAHSERIIIDETTV